MKTSLTYYSSICVFLFFSLSLVIPSGYSYGSALLVLVSLPFLFIRESYQNIDRPVAIFLASFILFSLIWILEVTLHHQTSNEFGKPSRFLLAAIVLLYLLKYPPKESFIWSGIALGSIGTGILAIYISLTTGESRVSGYATNAIPYGNMSISLGLLCISGAYWSTQQKYKKLWFSLMVFGFLLGTTASVLSGSRGGWISIPFALCVYLIFLKENLSTKSIFVGISILLISSISLFFIPQSGVKERIAHAVSDIQLYQDNQTTTSIGSRFELWKGALIISKEHPIFGVGKATHLDKTEELTANSIITPHIISDPHNMYLTALVYRGVIGLASLLFLYLAPIYIFKNIIRKMNGYNIALPLAGIIYTINFIDFGLTDSTLKHNGSVMMFVFTLTILFSSSISTLNSYKKVNSENA